MQPQMPLQKVMMALTCLAFTQFEKSPFDLNSHGMDLLSHNVCRYIHSLLNKVSSSCNVKASEALTALIRDTAQYNKYVIKKTQQLQNLLQETEGFINAAKKRLEPSPSHFCAGKPNGAIKITPNTLLGAFEVICESNKYGAHWMMVARFFLNSKGWHDANMPDMMVNGVSGANGEFFIGFKKLHALTESQLQELLIVSVDKNGVEHFDAFKTFGISDKYNISNLGTHTTDRSAEAGVETYEERLNNFNKIFNIKPFNFKLYIRPTTLKALSKTK